MSIIAVAGRVGRDAEVRATPNGKYITNFTIAETIYSNGKKKSQWFQCKMFGERGEKLAQYIKKGGAVTVYGTLEVRQYTDKQGMERTAVEIAVNDVVLQGNATDNQSSSQQRQHSAPIEDIEDDIPL
ncbi:single-stranded DNA-binding protein [Wielerella bovis]|uniref:single-stranded DNA-binding protein n=1 Tax=Wielerella bovis TaxID=2917790 RepID=UPI0020199CB8|nr:single-stranded DNA-binding protein [Wielerella bovis]ULJ60817.1 single-stranded DNA-binding protein [Wielerella bovis]